MIQRPIKAILLLFCSCGSTNVNAAGKNSLGLLSSKVKDAAAQSSVAKVATEGDDASNDSHPYLYDLLLVESVTIDGTKVKPGSKASKLPSRSPAAPSLIPAVMSQDDDSFTDDNSAFPGANETVAMNNTDDSFPIDSSLSPSQTSHGQTTSITSVPTSNVTAFLPTTLNATTAVSTAPSPLMIIEDTTTIPTISVSDEAADAKPSENPTAPPALDLDECPKQFSDSAEYYEFDVVSLAKRRYECKQWPKDTYCNGK